MTDVEVLEMLSTDGSKEYPLIREFGHAANTIIDIARLSQQIPPNSEIKNQRNDVLYDIFDRETHNRKLLVIQKSLTTIIDSPQVVSALGASVKLNKWGRPSSGIILFQEHRTNTDPSLAINTSYAIDEAADLITKMGAFEVNPLL